MILPRFPIPTELIVALSDKPHLNVFFNLFSLTGAVMFQYYLKIVPTMYVKLDRTVLHTNQFSVTRHQKSVSNINAESGMPGAFFSYELSPLMVKYTEKER